MVWNPAGYPGLDIMVDVSSKMDDFLYDGCTKQKLFIYVYGSRSWWDFYNLVFELTVFQ